MLVLEFRFPAGRYHATPWGRNVNEGEVEWPPSPYRLVRALVDACHRRRPEWPDERLKSVLLPLSVPPVFWLPPATAAHTRSFLSSNTKDSTAKQKIFDAFVVVDRDERLLAGFDCDVTDQVRADLNELLGELNYFGRTESWVSARILDRADDVVFNCGPAGYLEPSDQTERVSVACLRSDDEYGALPRRPMRKVKGKKKPKPMDWLDTVRLSTSELLDDGWSAPPSLKMIDVQRPVNALKRKVKRRKAPLTSRFRVARYALHSTVLPRITDTVAVAERTRTILMGIHRRVVGGDPAAVSPLFSGKTPEGGPALEHGHAFFLPLDEDGDGRIDHLLISVSDTFDASELEALDQLRKLWKAGGRPDIRLVLVSLAAELPGEPSTGWVSATPFVTARHYRRGRGAYLEWLGGEVRKECGFHGLPEPASIEWIDRTRVEGHELRWMEFTRNRKGNRPLRGHGCVLTFSEPAKGPFALGALSHFGLGLFIPDSKRQP